MRPNITLWSDHRSPTRTRWRSPYRRRTRSSIGPKILLVAVACVAGVVGISGIYPQIIDSEWVQNAGIHAKRTGEPTKTRGSGLVTAIPLSPHPAATTGEAAALAPRAAPPAPAAAASAPRAAPPAAAEPSKGRSTVAAVELPPNDTAPPAAELPDAQAMADPSTPAAADPTAKPAAAPTFIRPAQRYVARAPVVKKRVARTEHHRGNSGYYAQYGGWGGGWGWPGMGSPYHF